MKLLIAIPALNEEDSIAAIIERCLAAREHIIANSPVTEVEITVVSDGSTDRTVELASAFTPAIRLIVFEKNGGYGAAIQEAWMRSDAGLLGFLDADGTCDPNFFAPLCRAIVDRNASVALGSRLHSGSKMPRLRRLGNTIFASLLSMFSSAPVRDSASGMRVVDRECLDRLMPLPKGLDFTPAMSARCFLSSDLPIYEIDMPYHERAGRSKLSVVRDGFRFLNVILRTALLYRPLRPLGILSVFGFAVASALMIGPLLYYLRHRAVAEWMIYRFVVSHLIATAALLLACMGYVTRKIVRLTISNGGSVRSYYDPLSTWVESRAFWAFPLVLIAAGGALVFPSYRQLVLTGATYEHWSRFIVMSFLVTTAVVLGITRGISAVLDLVGQRLSYLASLKSRAPARRHDLSGVAGQ